ncbi:hypothetical protein WJX73_007117 [Symbiochloris irregularis]|uniref:mitogen-activated protein kinase kinase kinase n=1 Tax=Symbiochloris irregularis TaxID=706552 RepID=A0AAW1PJI6_9CHLO
MGGCLSSHQSRPYRDYSPQKYPSQPWPTPGVLDVREPSRKALSPPSPSKLADNGGSSPRRRTREGENRYATANSPVRGSPTQHRRQDSGSPTGLGLGFLPDGAPVEPAVAVKDWVRGGLLGAGGFGQVYLAFDKERHGLFAVKQVSLSTDAALRKKVNAHVTNLEQEVSVLSQLRHDNIVRYYGTERTADHLNIFLEYVAGGTMANIASGFGGLGEPAIARYTAQLLRGLDYLHSHGVAHRDIKGANILVSQYNEVKLADFGASRKIEDLVTVDSGFKSLKGTPYWMAPEVVKGEGHGRSADIWSLGATVLEMLTGKHPWPATENHFAAFNQIAHAKGGPPIPAGVSHELTDFLGLCFNRDAKQRANARRLLKHPFLSLALSEAGSSPFAPLGTHPLHGKDPAHGMEPLSLLHEHLDASPTIAEEDEWLVSAHTPPTGAEAHPPPDSSHIRPDLLGTAAESSQMRPNPLDPGNALADQRPDAGQGPKLQHTTTYNPMQEPSWNQNYTYNHANDLMDDADSSVGMSQQLAPPVASRPTHAAAQEAAPPSAREAGQEAAYPTSPFADSARTGRADERNVLTYLSQKVRGNHVRASAAFRDLFTDVLPSRTARSQPDGFITTSPLGGGMTKLSMKSQLSQPLDAAPASQALTKRQMSQPLTSALAASAARSRTPNAAEQKQWEAELWADVESQKHNIQRC